MMRGAGKEKSNAEPAIIFHGDAVLSCLDDEAYTSEFKTADNPNLELTRSPRSRR